MVPPVSVWAHQTESRPTPVVKALNHPTAATMMTAAKVCASDLALTSRTLIAAVHLRRPPTAVDKPIV